MTENRKRIYIAGPYSRGDVGENIRNALIAAEQLAAQGFVPFIPHLTHLWHLIFPHEIEFWYDYDLLWLEVCDALLRLPGESFGADNEIQFAKDFGIPVFYSIKELLSWDKED